MRDQTAIGSAEANALESAWPFIWLFEVKTLDTTPLMYRMTDFQDQVVHRTNVFYPAPLKVSSISSSGRGDLPSVDIVLGNASLELASVVDAGDGYIGQRSILTLVNYFEIGDEDAGIRFDGEVTALSMNAEAVSFTVSARDLYRAKIPPFRYARRKCRFLLADGGCGYSLVGSPAYQVCPGYTFEACELVGADELARGLTVKHPERIGAYPGIPRPRGTL